MSVTIGSIAPDFTQSIGLLAVSFVVPLACVFGGWWSRFRERAFFVDTRELMGRQRDVPQVSAHGRHRALLAPRRARSATSPT